MTPITLARPRRRSRVDPPIAAGGATTFGGSPLASTRGSRVAWVRALSALALIGSVLGACGGAGFVRMARRPVVWVDRDRVPFSPRPNERYVSWRGDAVDHLLLRPLAEMWTFPADQVAINVNAWDEVPGSSWFTHRMGRRVLTPGEVARGACDAIAPEAPTPWTVVGGKPDGSHPGLTIEDANGVRYLLKTDGELQPERATAADAIGAAIYYAAGYTAPCNRVARVRREELVLADDAHVEQPNGVERPLTDEDVARVLASAGRLADGHFRVQLSRFFEHEPIGPWSYEGLSAEDPNDAVPHELRREVRGMYLLAAWTGHIDVRQENTLALWNETSEGVGFVEHALVDFGDCFGVTIENDRISRRFEHDHYMNLSTVLLDSLTLGLLDRPWNRARGSVHGTLGYFDAERFAPDEWAPGYPNPAFDARTEHDDAWMARILARFSEEHVRNAVSVGQLSGPSERALTEILMERRRRILERYLLRLSPLAWPRTEERPVASPPADDGGARQQICFEDLAVSSGVRGASERVYAAQLVYAEPPRPSVRLLVSPGPCVAIPRGVDYVAIDIAAGTRDRETSLPLRAHVYDGEVYGLERLARPSLPGPLVRP